MVKKAKKQMPPKGMHDMSGRMMKDSDMPMSKELKARYPSMVKKGRKK
jgi:hypothetical protein